MDDVFFLLVPFADVDTLVALLACARTVASALARLATDEAALRALLRDGHRVVRIGFAASSLSLSRQDAVLLAGARARLDSFNATDCHVHCVGLDVHGPVSVALARATFVRCRARTLHAAHSTVHLARSVVESRFPTMRLVRCDLRLSESRVLTHQRKKPAVTLRCSNLGCRDSSVLGGSAGVFVNGRPDWFVVDRTRFRNRIGAVQCFTCRLPDGSRVADCDTSGPAVQTVSTFA